MTDDRTEDQMNESDSAQPRSLKHRAFRASLWILGSQVFGQVLRFASNLILTRLLFPKAFGLMALVSTFLTGLHMFSDVGIGPSIIQNKRGDDPEFLNTAWTIQVLRGFGLWLCTCLIAWPAAQFFHEPMLMQLLPVVGLTALISGFDSTKLVTANRKLILGRVTFIELTIQTLNLVTTAVIAWIFRSVWALVIGWLISSLANMILSHVVLEGERNRFHWNPSAFKELHKFGRWIFFNTALSFLAYQSDRLVLGRLLDITFLGVYSLAQNLSRMSGEVINQVSGKVLFPSYSELLRDRPEAFRSALRRSRLTIILVNWGSSLFFIFFGNALVHILYDNRYADAGWMLQTMAIGGLISSLPNSYSGVLLAKGKVSTLAFLQAFQVAARLISMFVGFHLGGQHGVIIGLVCADWAAYPIEAIILHRLSMWQPEIDFPFIGAAFLIAAMTWFR